MKHHIRQGHKAEIHELQEQIHRRDAEDAATLRNMRATWLALDAPSRQRVAGFIGGGLLDA
jgi:hypothetical protein